MNVTYVVLNFSTKHSVLLLNIKEICNDYTDDNVYTYRRKYKKNQTSGWSVDTCVQIQVRYTHILFVYIYYFIS